MAVLNARVAFESNAMLTCSAWSLISNFSASLKSPPPLLLSFALRCLHLHQRAQIIHHLLRHLARIRALVNRALYRLKALAGSLLMRPSTNALHRAGIGRAQRLAHIVGA